MMKTVYYNGRVYTGTLPLCQAFAVEDGRFLQVGSDAELLASASENASAVNLQGVLSVPASMTLICIC